jgi:SAM-dependent methyltransferase
MEWEHLASSYDVVARAYEDTFLDELDAKPRDRELLIDFTGRVAGPVLDVGCGPGHVGAFVAHLGPRTIGVDRSPAMAAAAASRVAAAVVADMRQLPFASTSVGGIVAFYSVIHVRRGELPAVLAEFARVLRPGGHVLYSAHEGEGDYHADRFLDHDVPFDATMFTLAELVDAAVQAGLSVEVAEQRAPYPTEGPTTRLYVEAVCMPDGRTNS